MSPQDLAGLAWGALRGHRLRTRMTYAALAVGVASVLVLTGLGEGARDWVVQRFAALGSSTLVTLPGRTQTRGGPPLAAMTTRDLTIDDFLAVQRHLPGVVRAVPLVIGESMAKHQGRGRTAIVVGSTADFLRIRGVRPSMGIEMPEIDVHRGTPVCLIGRTIQRDVFGAANPLGAVIKLGDNAFRVIGVIGQTGEAMMVNLDEIVMVPVASAMRMFNRSGLFRIIVQVSSFADLTLAQARLTALLKRRHDDEEDFTILTPGAIAASLGNIIAIITMALAGIAAVSLVVAGIGVMNVMVVSVTERASEIGLMKAVGAGNGQVLAVFLAEAVVLSLIGGALGIASGYAATAAARALYPDIPFHVPSWATYLGFGVAASVGVAFGILPAMRAARLDPLESLRRKA